eukprot:11688988-Ditylum_brightwellii.AAC.1
MGHFTWPSLDIPSNFTAFSLLASRDNHVDMVSLAVKVVWGKGMETSNTKHLSKLKLMDATSTNALQHMKNNMAVLATKITEDHSILRKHLYQWVPSINNNEACLNNIGKEDLHFFNKILYIIDNTNDTYLQQCCT